MLRVLFALVAIAQTATAQPTPAPPKTTQPARTASAAAAYDSDYVIGPGDVLGVVFWREPDISGDVVVRPDGKVTVPVIGELAAGGLRPDALQALLLIAAAKYIQEPNVAVVVRTINSRKVFVTGQVNAPGSHALLAPTTVLQALALCGGLTEYADAKNITILRAAGGGGQTFKFNYRDVSKGKNLAQNILLQPGDTVVVP